jgi:hypothetical protein
MRRGAPSKQTLWPALIPSFFGSGFPAYPAMTVTDNAVPSFQVKQEARIFF